MQEGDKLLWVGQCQEDSSVLLASSTGKALHLPTSEAELRPQGRPARGLRVTHYSSLPRSCPLPRPRAHPCHVLLVLPSLELDLNVRLVLLGLISAGSDMLELLKWKWILCLQLQSPLQAVCM